jgi:hypothetical protein
MEFISQEDYFCDKLVNLQNPYFYIPLSIKQNYTNQSNNNDIVKYTRDKEVLFINIYKQIVC